MPDMDMAQVDGQMLEESLDVGALPIPGRQAVNGESMTQVVQPRLFMGPIGPADSGAVAEDSEVVLERVRFHPGIHPRREERGLGPRRLGPCRMLYQGSTELRSEGDQAGLAE